LRGPSIQHLRASLDGNEIKAFGHLGRHIHFVSGETVFAQEDMTAWFYNLLEGVYAALQAVA
jgi:CRP/FNR family transcriptional regulator